MDRVKQFSAHLRPSGLTKKLFKHQGNLSESDKAHILGVRTILGKKVVLYKDGTHIIKGRTDLSEEEMFNSEILRFTHASLLINQPVGDKRKIWVDATVDPVNIWLYGVTIKQFIHKAKVAIKNGVTDPSFILDQHPEHFAKEIEDVRNVKLS